MYYLNHINQINFLIIVCYSFLICTFSFMMNKENPFLRALGSSFFISFFLGAASFLVKKEIVENVLIVLSEPSMLAAFFIILLLSKKGKVNSIILPAICVFPVLILIIVTSLAYPIYYTLDKISVLIFCTLALLNMFLLRKEKGTKSILFWAMLLILAGKAANTFPQIFLHQNVFIGLKLAAYTMFTVFFYKETHKNILSKITQAEKQLNSINKSLDMEIKKRTFHIELSNQKLAEIAKTDTLTKALNKGAILDVIEGYISSSKISEFSILLFDIDHFKTVNDTLGHIVGDKCLKKLSVTAKSCIRDIDSFGRYGGDEFIIVLPGTSVSQAKVIAERLRQKVSESESPHFTISVGIAGYPHDGDSVKGIVSAADDGLYNSKRKGRNAVSHRNLF